uniref:Superoxide dismutase copper/zinc binding domain-containing protein n=1 Tax=Maylandia zebra TaxID=106582 RepID=A0A3P9B450_9CICH
MFLEVSEFFLEVLSSVCLLWKLTSLFRQASPFDLTELSVNLTNLQSNVAFYHVHDFPVRSLTNRCSNDSIGDHWNPFSLNRSSPTYPRVPGSTHDMYEVGDLSAKHGSIAGKNMVDMTFTDFNLPLFGKNSIVGRSVCNYNILRSIKLFCT